EANLNAWLRSDERLKLVAESEPMVEEFHARTVHTGFEQWFREVGAGGAPLSVWEMGMIVLLLLYPIFFLWGVFVGGPILDKMFGVPFAVALFVGNIFSVGMTGLLVPWTANNALAWWLQPKTSGVGIHLLGTAVILVIYAACVL